MRWADVLENFATAEGDRSGTVYRQLVSSLWDQGILNTDAVAAVPALVRVLAKPTTPQLKRAQLALLLGLLAEGRDDGRGQNLAALTRAAVRRGTPRYLEILGESTAPSAQLALTYLLGHFHEDVASILGHQSIQGNAGMPAIAHLERVLRFQDPSTGGLDEYAKQLVPDAIAPPDDARSQIRASILAPLGAEALFLIERA